MYVLTVRACCSGTVEGSRESTTGCFGMYLYYYHLRGRCPLMIVRLEVLNELVMGSLILMWTLDC